MTGSERKRATGQRVVASYDLRHPTQQEREGQRVRSSSKKVGRPVNIGHRDIGSKCVCGRERERISQSRWPARHCCQRPDRLLLLQTLPYFVYLHNGLHCSCDVLRYSRNIVRSEQLYRENGRTTLRCSHDHGTMFLWRMIISLNGHEVKQWKFTPANTRQ